MLLELDENNNVARKYTWGLDLAGLNGEQNRDREGAAGLESAGGTLDPIASRQGQVGGLLAVHDPEDDSTPDKNYIYFYDANGNVGQLIDWENDGALVAKYEYDPYGGNLLDPTDPQESGPYAADNPWRFSTKYFDAETALGYWGYRYYSPRLGRWLNRDPLGEGGGRNIYTSASNRPTGRIDPLGQQDTQPASQPAACCGLSVNHAVFSVLDRIDEYFNRIPKQEECNDELMRVCKGILQTDVGWDIRELAEVGAAEKYKESPLITRKCGTGGCAGTVQWGKTCYRANEMNYILWGALNRICNERKFEWMMLGEADEHGTRRYKDCDGNDVSTVVHTWWWTAAVVYGYRSAFNLGLVDHIPAAPAGQGSIRCRVAWARRGYHLGGVPKECEVKECGYCSETYSGELSVRVAGDPVP